MGELIVAAAFLLATHFGISSTALRPALSTRIGEKPYLALHSVIALAAILWLVRAYNHAPYIELWGHAPWTGWLALIGMLPASLLAVAGLSAPNPSAPGQDKLLESKDPARGVFRITRHPLMWAVGLWGIVHVPANGDLASLVLFGALAALALVGTRLIDAKKATQTGERWARFAGQSSNLPFLAIAQGRQRLTLIEIGWIRIAAGVVLFAVLWGVHPWLFGAAPVR